MQIAKFEIILLDMSYVQELTGWCKVTVNKLFRENKQFPALFIGNKYQVELHALIEFLHTRNVKTE